MHRQRQPGRRCPSRVAGRPRPRVETLVHYRLFQPQELSASFRERSSLLRHLQPPSPLTTYNGRCLRYGCRHHAARRRCAGEGPRLPEGGARGRAPAGREQPDHQEDQRYAGAWPASPLAFVAGPFSLAAALRFSKQSVRRFAATCQSSSASCFWRRPSAPCRLCRPALACNAKPGWRPCH